MMQYNPAVKDNRADYIMQAANTQADSYKQMGKDIGGALASIGDMYGEIEGQKAKGRAFKDVFKVVSPSLGISMEQLEAVAGGKIKSDRDWYQMSEMFTPMMPSLINGLLGQQRLGVQQGMPAAKAQYGAAAQVANGQGRMPAPSSVNFDAVP